MVLRAYQTTCNSSPLQVKSIGDLELGGISEKGQKCDDGNSRVGVGLERVLWSWWLLEA